MQGIVRSANELAKSVINMKALKTTLPKGKGHKTNS